MCRFGFHFVKLSMKCILCYFMLFCTQFNLFLGFAQLLLKKLLCLNCFGTSLEFTLAFCLFNVELNLEFFFFIVKIFDMQGSLKLQFGL